MQIYLGFIFFIIGTAVGSFLGVVIDRLPRKKSIWVGRSVCDSCHKKLTPIELVPVVSYIVQGGKCRKCHAKLPLKLLICEVLTGLAFVLVYLVFPLSAFHFQPTLFTFFTILYLLLVMCLNIVIFYIDLDFGIIPDELIGVFVITALLYNFIFFRVGFIVHIFSGLGAFLLFLFLYLITRGRGMGFGDVKYALAIGLFLGFPAIIVSLYFAFLTGAAISLILIVYGNKHLKSSIPFGPFLAAGTIFACFWGESAIKFIFKVFNW